MVSTFLPNLICIHITYSSLKEQYICLLVIWEDCSKNNEYYELDITAFCCYKELSFSDR